MNNQYNNSNASAPISWWSWRPGIQPRNALLLGIPLMFIGLLLSLLGLVTLVVGIEDSRLPPLRVPGTVRQHNASTTFSSPSLTITLKGPKDIPAMVTLAVAKDTFQQIPPDALVGVNYSPHLHFAYALEYAGKYYTVSGSSAAGNPSGSVALLLLGLLLLPYPLLLTHWGWQDLLIERYKREKRIKLRALVVDKRATAKTPRTGRPGFTGRGSQPWYGLALLPLDKDTIQRVTTFSVDAETYGRAKDDSQVTIIFSPYLHYVYSVQRVEE